MTTQIIKTALTFDDVQMVPCYSEVPSRSSKFINTRTFISRNYAIDFPVISSNMDTVTSPELIIALNEYGATGALHRMQSIDGEIEQVCMLVNNKVFPVISSIGVDLHENDVEKRYKMFYDPLPPMDDLYRARCLVNAGANIILIDVAHGHHIKVRTMIQHLKHLRTKEHLNFDIMVGNVATFDAVCELIDWGADSIKCGIGNGSACTTRINTGFGIPSFTSLCECVQAAQLKNIPIIWDGGIKTSGDMAKAIGAGASAVMIGSLFAGTEESPGRIKMKDLYPNKGIVKEYRGSASFDCKISHGYIEKNIEGVSTSIPYKGSVKWVINYLIENFYSSMSYAGARSIKEFREKVKFVQITHSGINEALPHIKLTQ